jgi:hypothetical protein
MIAILHTLEILLAYIERTLQPVLLDASRQFPAVALTGPVEVKQTATPRPAMASGLVSFMADYPDKTDRGWLIHLSNAFLPLSPNVTAAPFAEL